MSHEVHFQGMDMHRVISIKYSYYVKEMVIWEKGCKNFLTLVILAPIWFFDFSLKFSLQSANNLLVKVPFHEGGGLTCVRLQTPERD